MRGVAMEWRSWAWLRSPTDPGVRARESGQTWAVHGRVLWPGAEYSGLSRAVLIASHCDLKLTSEKAESFLKVETPHTSRRCRHAGRLQPNFRPGPHADRPRHP